MKKLLLILSLYASSILAADELTLIKTDIQNLEKKADRITMELRDLEREMKGLRLDEFSYTQKKSRTDALIKIKQEIAAKNLRLLEQEIVQLNIAQLNDDIRLIDSELSKNSTHRKELGERTYLSKKAMDLLDNRTIKLNAIESKQQELKELQKKQ